ncbi:hypothetical protein [Amycolatopsis minnesotensis]|uniref:Uncharacterized protein n=1 Tax=Amycolatopsis minnesotensis TaxID=337894 RepID=A0ABP5DMQ7_9PSEU
MKNRAVEALALFAALQATFSDVHPVCDQILQRDADAVDKGKAGWTGRKASARHVGTYTAGQLLAAVGVTRGLGFRLPGKALLVGTAINAVTHYVIDRRTPLDRMLRSTLLGKGPYLDHATVVRRVGPGGEPVVDASGPGTAFTECDQSAHRLISVDASVTTTWLALRSRTGREA